MKFSDPFWFTDLLSSLDSLCRLGFDLRGAGIKQALAWFVAKQRSSAVWELKMVRGTDKARTLWLSLAICCVIKSFCD